MVRWFIASLWLVAAALSVLSTALVISGEEKSVLFFIDTSSLAITFLTIFIVHTRRIRLAGFIILSVLFIVNTFGYLTIGQTVSLPNAIGYVVIVTIAGLFFGSYGLLTFLSLAFFLMTGAFIYTHSIADKSVSTNFLSDLADLVSILTGLLTSGFILHILLRKNQDALQQIEQIAQALEISNRKLRQHQKLLEENQNQLEGLVEQRTSELKEANKQLQLEADKRQSVLDALQQSEAKWRSLVNSAPDRILTFSTEGTITFVNRLMDDEFTLHVAGGESIYALCETEEYRRILENAVEHAQKTGQVAIFETQRDTSTGTLYYMHRLAAIKSNDELSGFILTTTDISDHRRTEIAMRQAQKLESLGLFAGGVAHDFNNLLTAILAQNSLMFTKVLPTDPLSSHIQKAILATEQAMHLTRQMLDYTGRSLTQISPTDLGHLIRNNVELFSAALPKNVQVLLDIDGNLPCIRGDAGQIQQLLMNLLLNGADAIGKKQGQITIVAQHVQIAEDADYSEWMPDRLPSGSYVMLQVVDNGCGMDVETISKIFDPFFTTKFTGRGLGLASVLGIVRNHKGGLAVESSPDVGTTFKLIFPASLSHQEPIHPEHIVDSREFAGERVLVVDDEEAVREAAIDLLSSVGLEVISAADGHSAINYYKEQSTDIKVVILDLSMPGMSGEDVLQALRQLDRNIPIILTSGYDERDVMSRLQTANFTSFIQKPYDLDRLLDSVARYL
ncbi:MAG: response regulator [Caldilineaceae bacterium]